MTNTKWWKNEVVYQVYPRSFQDTNNDGIGDIQGIISHLDDLKKLGITMIWISPFFTSPMVDMGYDIADYQDIDPQFGTMADFDELMAEAEKRDMKIILDLVVNHTSDQHEWFKQALADPTSKYRDYYIFKTTEDGKEPNNWRGIFGGSTWTEVPGEPGTYYFHSFAVEQPDLNWENPTVRREIYDMINWWLDKGVAGWRVDAITHLKKDLDWASIPADGSDGLATVSKKGQNRPGIDVFLDELKRETFDKYDAITVGEAYGLGEGDLEKYIGPDGYFSMIFDFSNLNIEVNDVNEWYRGLSDWTTKDFKKTLFKSHEETKEVNGHFGNVLENHDQPRIIAKLIKDPNFRTPTAAKALGAMYYYLPGVPFIYQGQEIGMKNFTRHSIDQFNDVSSISNYEMAKIDGFSEEDAMFTLNAKSRDNARTPMQWDGTEFGGFSTVEPWLEMTDDREGINYAAEEGDENSVLSFYRAMNKVRVNEKWHDTIIDGELVELTDVPDDVVAYQRTLGERTFTVLVNMGTETQTVSIPEVMDGEVLLVNDTDESKTLSGDKITLTPYAAMVIGQ